MADTKIFKNLGVFLEPKEVTTKEGEKLLARYTQPNSPTPDKIWEHGDFVETLNTSGVLDKLLSLTKGDKFCAHVGKNQDNYPVLINITDAKDAEKTETKKEWKSSSNKKEWQPKDETGIAVGAAWTNAIEIIKLIGTNETNYQLVAQEVARLAEEVLKLKLAQEDRVRAVKLAKQETKEKAKEEPKEESLLEKKKRELAVKRQNKTEPVEESPDPRQGDIDNELQDDLDDITF